MKQRSYFPQQPLPFPRAIAHRLRSLHSLYSVRSLHSGYTKLLRYGRCWCWRLTRSKGSAKYLARGFAVGTFAGFFPLFGIQTAIGVLLAIPLRGHKLTAAVGTWVSNPITYIPLFWFNFRVGNWLLGTEASFTPESLQSLEALLELKEVFVTTLLVGCLVCGLVGSLLSYFIALRCVRSWRHRRTPLKRRRHHPGISASKPATVTLDSHSSKSIDLS